MAIPFLNNIDLSDNQLLNAKLHITSTAPTAATGQIYFDSTADPGGNPPTYDLTAKYYSNDTDLWVSLKEYSFPAGSFITGTVTGTTPKPIITFDLSATGTADDTTYLRGDNQWEPISAIPGTYKFTIKDNASPTPVTGTVDEDDTVQIAANSDLTSNLAGQATTTKTLTVGLKVDGGVGVSNNYIVNQGSATAAADDTIPFNDYTSNIDPLLDTDIVKKTTFGTIPVESLTLVKNYIDSSIAGGLIYQGGYNATTNIPALDNRDGTTQIAVNKGWTYTVTTAGTFYGEVVEVGDVLIAEDNLSSGTGSLSDWTTVQNNIGIATAGTDTGVGAAVIGISRYDNADFTVSANGFVQLNSANSFSGTIGDNVATSIQLVDTGAVAPNINHGMGTDSSSFMIQLVAVSSGETVYADVTRGASGLVTIDFAVAPAANDIRVLIQKIG